MTIQTLAERARVFATAAHAAVGQLRKYTHEPYVVHPAEVVILVVKQRRRLENILELQNEHHR